MIEARGGGAAYIERLCGAMDAIEGELHEHKSGDGTALVTSDVRRGTELAYGATPVLRDERY
eukprot:3940513-Rhodomonas_salina.1